MLTVGNNWKLFHEQVGEIMTKELLEVGLIDIDLKEIKGLAKEHYFDSACFLAGILVLKSLRFSK